MSKSSGPWNNFPNPFEPPSVHKDGSQVALRPTFSPQYWTTNAAIFVGSIILTFVIPQFAIFWVGAIISSFFVILRSWMWSYRLSTQQRAGLLLPTPTDPVQFFFSSIGVSLLATVASLIAFASICVPLGSAVAFLLQRQVYGPGSPILFAWGFSALVIVCGGFGLWLGAIITRATLPKLSKERQPIDNKSAE